MRKTIGARECSGIEHSGVDAGERKEKAVHPQRGKAQQGKRKRHGPERQRRSKAAHGQENRNTQQSSTRSGEPEHAAREGGSQKEVRRTFKMLREVLLNIGMEKIDMHKGVIIKALLDSGAIGMFMDRQMAARHGFKLQKLERPIAVRNVDGTNNSGGAITHQVECNVFFKGHVERM